MASDRGTCYNTQPETRVEMDLPSVITIDGPAASGKSTLGERLARRLGYTYFDTGVLYRALTLQALRHRLPLNDADALAGEAAAMQPLVLPPTHDDGRQYTIMIDGEDVTWTIREPDVERNVSTVSAYPAVRAALREQQRAIGRRGGVVMVGRDIGGVVMPDADFKVFLVASPEERARRRFAELRAKGRPAEYDGVLTDLRRRDELDRANTHQPSDAVVIDSDGMDPDDVVGELLTALERRTQP